MNKRQHILDTPIEYLKGVGPKRGKSLREKLSIHTFGDLMEYYPFRYIDKTKLYKISDITPDTQYVQIKGTLANFQVIGDGRAKRITATLRDETGVIELIWFKGVSYVKNSLKKGAEYLVFGKPSQYNYKYNIAHPEMEAVETSEIALASRFEAVYGSSDKLKTFGLGSRGIHKLIKTLFERIQPQDIFENLPQPLRTEHKLIGRYEALKNIHLPDNEAMIGKAQYRLKFEEFFFIQLKLQQIKINRHQKTKGFEFPALGKYFNKFYHEKLPFELTGAQKRVLKEIRRNTMSGAQMNRLVQGDVGSGKTIVAIMTMLMAADSGFQSCLMAPTEILAQQHFEGIGKMLDGLGLNVEILTGSVKGKQRRMLLDSLQLGLVDILVGTHALIEDNVVFKNLGMVVIDEQHRFGVAQRAKLWEKNVKPPHVLVMTATPIPRTLAMTVYGDLDVSVIDELPPGRKPIKTFHYKDKARLKVFGFLKKEIDEGRQVYIVYPLINESETLDYKDLMDGYESVSRAFPMPKYKVSVVHGQMRAADKEMEMQRFKRHETHIMVATTVIEVGVDVPNASVIVLESAERFGLAQLHQLRGRVGRGKNQSYCILMTGNKLSNDGKTRMQTMVDTTDGFKIAEVDLQLRGPGNMEGTEQSGVLNLRIANITKDTKILQIARNAAAELVTDDPTLIKPENANLKHFINHLKADSRSKWSRIS